MRFVVLFLLAVSVFGQRPAVGGGSGGGGGTGTVTTVSVATANGFAGTVANSTTTPAITVKFDPALATGIVKSTTATGIASIATSADTILQWSGTCDSTSVLGADAICKVISSAFSGITSGTNTTAAMLVGAGASLATTSTGTIAATSVTGLSVTAGKTLTVTGSMTQSVTDSSTVAFGAGGTVLYNGGAGGTPSSINLTNGTALPWAGLTATAHNTAALKTCVAASASTTTYTCSTTPTFTPAAGDMIYFQADLASSSTTPTVNANSQGNKTVKLQNTTILTGSLLASGWYLLLYDGTAWEMVGQTGLLQAPGAGSNWDVNSSGVQDSTQLNLYQAAGNTNIWQTYAPGSKIIGMMSDHTLVWRSQATGSFYSVGSSDTGISRIGAGVVAIGTGANGSIAGTLSLANLTLSSGAIVTGGKTCTINTTTSVWSCV